MNPLWNAPPARLLLSTKDVHIWRAGIDLPGRSLQELEKTLSSDERARSERFHFAQDRSRFIAARGILRLILACYLSVEPGSIEFSYEKSGKPGLQNAFCKTGVQFNLSHSAGLALYVFARGRGVGVDIEYTREISEMEQIVEQFFSARERVVFAKLPTSEKQDIFYHWWTRKEAFMKAVGEGFSYPLCMFDAVLAEGKPAESLEVWRGEKEGLGWSMWDVNPAGGFAGAVVVKGEGSDVQCWEWPG